MNKWKILIGILALIIISRFAFDNDLTVRTYELATSKVAEPVRIALITDLHSYAYGEGQKELLDLLAVQKPDIVLFGGDIVDDDRPLGNMLTLVAGASQKYPCYYVTGNHEWRRGNFTLVKKNLSLMGSKCWKENALI